MTNTSNDVEKIINKIQGLLKIAQDKSNDEECQSAFLMAQRLMLKHNLSQSDVQTEEEKENVTKDSPTEHKSMSWWEKALANIISENFRVKHYYNFTRNSGETRSKIKFVFVGLENDVEIAKEMYILAHASILFYTEKHLSQYAKNRRERKKAYIKGFVQGIEMKFDEQRNSLMQEYGLVVLTPAIVNKEFEELDLKSIRGFSIPNIDKNARESYTTGFEEGSSIDFTKRTLDE